MPATFAVFAAKPLKPEKSKSVLKRVGRRPGCSLVRGARRGDRPRAARTLGAVIGGAHPHFVEWRKSGGVAPAGYHARPDPTQQIWKPRFGRGNWAGDCGKGRAWAAERGAGHRATLWAPVQGAWGALGYRWMCERQCFKRAYSGTFQLVSKLIRRSPATSAAARPVQGLSSCRLVFTSNLLAGTQRLTCNLMCPPCDKRV